MTMRVKLVIIISSAGATASKVRATMIVTLSLGLPGSDRLTVWVPDADGACGAWGGVGAVGAAGAVTCGAAGAAGAAGVGLGAAGAAAAGRRPTQNHID